MKKNSVRFVSLMFFITCLALTVSVSAAQTFPPKETFSIPTYNSSISFATGGSYDSLSLESNTLNFKGVVLDNYSLNFSNSNIDTVSGVVTGREVLNYSRNSGDFSVSAQNCNITILNYDLLTRFLPAKGWLNYTVTGTGNQTFNLHYTSTAFQPLDWIILVNGALATENETWVISDDGWLTVSGSDSNVSIYYEKVDSPKEVLTNNLLPTVLPYLLVGGIVIAILVGTVFLVKRKRQRAERQR
jgi:hypothetical protein